MQLSFKLLKSRTTWFLMVTLLFTAVQGYSQKKISVSEQQKDLEVLKQILEVNHAGLFRYQSKQNWDSHFNNLTLDAPLSTVLFNYEVRKLLSTIQCGHTASYIPRETRIARLESEEIQLMPLLIDFSDNTIVVDVDSSQNRLSGAELLEVNGLPVDSLYQAWKSHTFQGDAGIATRTPYFMRDDFPYLYHDLIGNTSQFKLKIRTNGEPREVTVSAVSSRKFRTVRRSYLNQIEKSWLSLTTQPEEKKAYMRVQFFGNYELRNGEKGRYVKFMKQSFARLKKEGIQNLIIDLRENGGGEGRRAAELFAYIALKPFQYFRKWELNTNKLEFPEYASIGGIEKMALKRVFNKHVQPNGEKYMVTHWYGTLKEMKPASDAFQGKVILLIDGRTFSAASDFAAVALSNNRVTIVGEETGGAAQGNNSGILLNYVLPNSKIRLQIPLARGENNVKPELGEGGVVPDYPIKTSGNDKIKGEDTVLEFAYELLRKGK